MKIGILFSCQQQIFGDALRCLLPEAEMKHFELNTLGDPALREAVGAIMRSCDHVISCGAGPEFGVLSDDALRAAVPRFDVFPSFSFAGFHPDTVYVQGAAGSLVGITHHYHSRIAIGAWLAGRGLEETAALYNALVFGRLGYFDCFAHERAMASNLFGHFGIDLAPLIDRWRARPLHAQP